MTTDAASRSPSADPRERRDDRRAARAGVRSRRSTAAAELIAGALRAGGKVLLFGNGGSAADAKHIAAELVGRFLAERRALPALSLSDNTSAVTAIGNDYGFERVFARQVEALGAPGDVALGISTSGRSRERARGPRRGARARPRRRSG